MSNTGKGIIIYNGMYHVDDYPFEKVEEKGPECLKKGVAYIYDTDLTHGIFPYRGIIDDNFSYDESPVGLYFRKKHGKYKLVIVRPRTMQDAKQYDPANIQDLVAMTLGYGYNLNQFADNKRNMADMGSDIFLPPMHAEDDFLNTIVKLGIRKKCAPFEPYGVRLEAMAADSSSTSEGSNIKNNGKRGLYKNFTMSPSKAVQFSDVWQMEIAVILRDSPDAMHKALPEGKAMVVYANGEPFDINNEDLIDVSDVIDEAIAETTVLDRAQDK